MQVCGIAQISLGCSAVPCCQSNLACVAKHSGVANADLQCCLNLLQRFGIMTVGVKRPGVCVESEDVVPATVFTLCNRQRLCRLMSVVSVVENQFTVRIVCAHTFELRFGLKFRKGFLGLFWVAGEF